MSTKEPIPLPLKPGVPDPRGKNGKRAAEEWIDPKLVRRPAAPNPPPPPRKLPRYEG